MARADDEVFVIGGERVFREALDRADRIHLTELEQEFDGDVRFPELPAGAWRQVAVETLRDEKAGLAYSNRILERVRQ
jgi:dihydrofolate reductase